jgi:hypothetical protein
MKRNHIQIQVIATLENLTVESEFNYEEYLPVVIKCDRSGVVW